MNMKKQSLSLKFTSAAFLLSLGGPIGFYFHDYLFGPTGSDSLWAHITHINQDQISTVIYIALGTIFFFTVFGAALGNYVEKLIDLEREKKREEKHKKDLFKFLLNDIKRQVVATRESLLILKEEELSIQDQKDLIFTLDHDLESFNDVIDSLINNDEEQDLQDVTTQSNYILKLFDDLSEKHDISIGKILKDGGIHKHEVKIKPTLLTLMLDNFFNFLQEHEIDLDSVQVQFLSLTKFQANTRDYQDSTFYACLHFQLKDCHIKDSDLPLLIELVKQFGGLYSFEENSLIIHLPAAYTQEEHRLNRAA